jgi:hypothetical protein
MPRAYLPLVLCGWLAAGPLVRADDFALDLEVKSGKAVKKAKEEAAGPRHKPKARAVLEVKAGQAITVKWSARSTAAKDVVKDVRIHFFVVKESKVGQAAVPKLDKNVTAESAIIMDFGPGDNTHGDSTFQIDTPGTYLVRLETLDAAVGVGGHDYFAALDLVVK